MPTFTIHQAKTQLSRLIALVEAGEDVATPGRRMFGAFAGRYPDLPEGFFFDPLPEEELTLWEGGDEPPSR